MPVRDVYVSITLYDASDVMVESTSERVFLEVLLVGRKSPFLYNVGTQENSAKVSYYLTSIISSFSSEKPQGLQILSHNSVVAGLPPIRIMTVTGQIKNVGTVTANAVVVFATFYDGIGNVVGVSLGPSVPVILGSGQEGSFTIAQDVSAREHLFVTYDLTADSLEYTIIPEFPASIILMIFMIATLTAAVMIRKRQLQNRV